MMREKSSSPRPFSSARLRERGFALVVVLVVILMLTVLVVGLLVMAENETKSAARYMDAADARLAADSVVQIVQGQIKAATLSGIDGVGKGSHAWASQPGAIRVYDDGGDLVNIYKLYSSPAQVVSVVDTLFDGTDLPGDWATRPDEFVDLNAPVSRGNQWIFPIASPEALGVVAGFTSTISNDAGTPWDDRLVMPVRWLYVQKDGSMNVDPSVGAPILRIAYWTDDESSKININTASATDANSYADIPRSDYKGERNIGWMQPAQNEFNRYPGHPATVNLSTVFSGSIKSLIEATPRYKWGGSENATKTILAGRTSLVVSPFKKHRLYTTADEFLFGTDRLAQLSLDAPQLDARRFFLTTTSRSSDLNLFGQPRVTIWPVSAVDDTNHRTPYDQLIAHCSTIGEGSAAAKPYYFLRDNPLSQTADWALPAVARNQGIFAYLRANTSREIPGYGGNFLNKYDVTSGGVSGERDQILTEIFDYIRCVNLNETYKDQPTSFVHYTTKTGLGADPNIFTRSGNSGATNPYIVYPGPGFVLPISIPAGDGRPVATRGAGRVPVISEAGIWLIQTEDLVTPVPPSTADPYAAPPNPPEVQAGLLLETFSPMQGYMPWSPYNFSIKVTNINPPMLIDFDGNQHQLFFDGQTFSVLIGPTGIVGQTHAGGGIDGWMWHATETINRTKFLNNNPLHVDNPLFTAKANAIPLSSGTLPSVPVLGATIGITAGELQVTLQCNATTPYDKDGAALGYNKQGGAAVIPYQTYRIKIPAMTLPVPDPIALPVLSGLPVKSEGWGQHYSGPKDDSGVDLGVNSQIIFFNRNEGRDVVRGLPVIDGDFRTIAYLPSVPASFFASDATTLPVNFFNSTIRLFHGFRGVVNRAYKGTTNGGYVNVPYGGDTSSELWDSLRPKISSKITDLVAEGWEGDFDNGMAGYVDGPYLNKSDEGTMKAQAPTFPPYYQLGWSWGDGLFSPLRQVPSAVVFGSLPTSIKRAISAPRPWRTLNFCPNPLFGSTHYGRQDPKDQLLLDLFTMPAVEPYAISEPFSTAGRLNMNFQIAPFTHISRKTALYAALASQKVIAIAKSDASDYKGSTQAPTVVDKSIRYAVNIPETLKQFDDTFGSGKIFKSASDICDVFLVPAGTTATAANISTWWSNYELTGNNSRERPYATLYPLLTTKSNVFTTHIRVQAIKRLPDGKIAVNSEYRGSVTFERFLDPNDPVFTDGSVNPDDVSLEPYFRFRTLVAKQFDP